MTPVLWGEMIMKKDRKSFEIYETSGVLHHSEDDPLLLTLTGDTFD
jgi:hypothetical protein